MCLGTTGGPRRRSRCPLAGPASTSGCAPPRWPAIPTCLPLLTRLPARFGCAFDKSESAHPRRSGGARPVRPTATTTTRCFLLPRSCCKAILSRPARSAAPPRPSRKDHSRGLLQPTPSRRSPPRVDKRRARTRHRPRRDARLPAVANHPADHSHRHVVARLGTRRRDRRGRAGP